MKFMKRSEILKAAINADLYVKYPDFKIGSREHKAVLRLNEDSVKELIGVLNKMSKGRKIEDISPQALKFRVKDDWYFFNQLSTSERLFMLAFISGRHKCNIVLHRGFSQMRPKLFRSFVSMFKDNDYLIVMCEDEELRSLNEMLQDNKVTVDFTYNDVGERLDITEKFTELKDEDFVDNIRGNKYFYFKDFKSERLNVIKSVTWANVVYIRDGVLKIVNPLNELSPELIDLFTLMARESEYLILKEPDVFLDSDERRMFYEYLKRSEEMYKGIYLSEYL